MNNTNRPSRQAFARLLVTATLLATAAVASATVLDFSSLPGSTSPVADQGASITEDGFTVTCAGSRFIAKGMGSQTFSSRSIAANAFGAVTTLAKSGGGSFNLVAISLDRLNLTGRDIAAAVTFTGTLSGGGTVSQTFTLDTQKGFQQFAFTGFTGVTSVSWSQEFECHQFDNVIIDQLVSDPIPEEPIASGTDYLITGQRVEFFQGETLSKAQLQALVSAMP